MFVSVVRSFSNYLSSRVYSLVMSRPSKTESEHPLVKGEESSAGPQAEKSVSVERGPHLRKLKRVKNVLTRMENYREGPLGVLRRCVEEHLKVKVWTRNFKYARGICNGYVVAYDKHWNLAMVDVEETYLNPVPATVTAVKKKRVRHQKRCGVVQNSETSVSNVSNQAVEEVEEVQTRSANPTSVKGITDDDKRKISNVIALGETSDLREKLLSRSNEKRSKSLLAKSSASRHSGVLLPTSDSSDVTRDVRHVSDLEVCDSDSGVETRRRNTDTLEEIRFSDSKRHVSLKDGAFHGATGVQLRELRTDERSGVSDIESERFYRTGSRSSSKRSSSCRDQDYRTSASNRQSRTCNGSSSSRSRLEEEDRPSSGTTRSVLAQPDPDKCQTVGVSADGSSKEQNSTSASTSYQPVLSRHVKQLFLRGDNVIFVAVVDVHGADS